MHFPDCKFGKEGEACNCAERTPEEISRMIHAAPANPEGNTMIEARRVGGLVVFYPKRWRRAKNETERAELVPLVYVGANPRGFAYFHEAEAMVLRYLEGPGDAPEARWDVDAGQWM